MKNITFLLRVITSTVLVVLIVASTAQKYQPKASLTGKWEWVSTQADGASPLTPVTTVVLVYKPGNTRDFYRNGLLVTKDRPFSVKRIHPPSGTAGVVDLMICPDETGFTEPYETVWLKGPQSDTLVFMWLDPNNRFKPYIYSVYKRVE